MKNIKRILVSIVLIAFLSLIIVVVVVQSMAPNYKGSKSLAGLSEEVQVYYDTYGVPMDISEADKTLLQLKFATASVGPYKFHIGISGNSICVSLIR